MWSSQDFKLLRQRDALLNSLLHFKNDPHLWSRLRGDLFGGTVAALIAVPYGMALAVAMGLRPEAVIHFNFWRIDCRNAFQIACSD